MSEQHVSAEERPGRQGAKRLSWDELSMRSWVLRYLEDHTAAEAMEALDEKVKTDDRARADVCDYFLSNVIMAMGRATPQPRKPATPPAAAPTQCDINAMFRVAQTIERAFLSDYKINGTPLGECSIAAVRTQAAKHGAHARFLVAIARDLPDEARVSDHYDNEQAAALFNAALTNSLPG